MRHSYTKISTYMQCPMKKKGKYELGIREDRGPQAARGVEIHKYFEEAVANGSPLPEEFSLYSDYVGRLRDAGAKPELKLGVSKDWEPLNYKDDSAWIVSILDLFVDQGTTGFAADYKTGKIYDDHVKQKEFYACVLSVHFPHIQKFTFTNVYLDLGKNIPHKWTREEVVEELRPRWQNRIEVMERDTDCVPTPNFSCRWCPVSHKKGGPCQF